MRIGTIKIETAGSYWWIDETAHEYARSPKHEGPREKAEWSDMRAGALQDFVWHTYEAWYVNTWGYLKILLPDGRSVTAPGAQLPSDLTAH